MPPGAEPALHDEHPAVWGTDDPVLLGLDGGHDVGHLAGAAGIQRGQERCFTRYAVTSGAVPRAEFENLVVDLHHFPVAGSDVPTPFDTVRRDYCGQVERPRG